MAGQLTTTQIQINDSPTATNNFVVTPDNAGGFKISRGNVGATTQDILSVDATGAIDTPITPKYFQPIDNTSAVTDLTLGVQQTAFINASAATSIPLHIACGDGQIYQLTLRGTFTSAAFIGVSHLQVNNANFGSNVCGYMQTVSAQGTAPINQLVTSAEAFFRLEGYGGSINEAEVYLHTTTADKITSSFAVSQVGSPSASTAISLIKGYCGDTTTVWSSLGTITLPNAWTGKITVRRVA